MNRGSGSNSAQLQEYLAKQQAAKDRAAQIKQERASKGSEFQAEQMQRLAAERQKRERMGFTHEPIDPNGPNIFTPAPKPAGARPPPQGRPLSPLPPTRNISSPVPPKGPMSPRAAPPLMSSPAGDQAAEVFAAARPPPRVVQSFSNTSISSQGPPAAAGGGGGGGPMSAAAEARIRQLEDEVAELRTANERFTVFMEKAKQQIVLMVGQIQDLQEVQEQLVAHAKQQRSAPAPAASPPAASPPAASRSRPRQEPEEEAPPSPPIRGAGSAPSQPAASPPPAAAAPPKKAPPPKAAPPPPPEPEDEPEEDYGDQNDLDDVAVGKGAGGGIPDGATASAGPLKPCPNCGRKFQQVALDRHIKKKVCQKKARKVFDSTQARLDGVVEDPRQIDQIKAAVAEDDKPKDAKKAKWKIERARLQAAMRAGKEIADAVKNGVPLSQIPSTPAEPEDDDRVQCPGCGRKFAKDTADRHIPKCAGNKDVGKKAAPPKKR